MDPAILSEVLELTRELESEGGYRVSEGLKGLIPIARKYPEVVPTDLVRAYATTELHSLYGSTVLALLGETEFIARIDKVPDLETVARLGPLTDSIAWFRSWSTLREVSELVLRRRCAGLRSDTPELRARLVAAVGEAIADGSPRDADWLAYTAAELDDEAVALALLRMVVETRWELVSDDPIVVALTLHGRAALAAMARHPARHDRAIEYRFAPLRSRIDQELRTNRRPTPYMRREFAVDAFVRGFFDCAHRGNGAYRAWGWVLRWNPAAADAAFSLAWIDRHYGTPIEPRRIDWIRSLGFRDHALLEELGRPVEPPTDDRLRVDIPTIDPPVQPELVALHERIRNATT